MRLPRPAAVAALDVDELATFQFSRRKAEYLTGVAQRIVAGELDLQRLATAPADEVEAALLAVRGLGPWSAHYVMMRAFGFEDCVPVGDTGLVARPDQFLLPHRAAGRRRDAGADATFRSLSELGDLSSLANLGRRSMSWYTTTVASLAAI